MIEPVQQPSTNVDTLQRSPLIASSSRIQPSPSPVSSNRQITSAVQSLVTGTDLDNFDIISCIVNRKSENQPLGVSLSTAVSQNRSLSRSVSSARGDDEVTLPIITSVEPGSLAEQSGLRAGDLVLEINGKSTTGQTNSTIASWIRSTGNQIEFLVSREKQKQRAPTSVSSNQQQQDNQIKDQASQIVAATIEAATRTQEQQQPSTSGHVRQLFFLFCINFFQNFLIFIQRYREEKVPLYMEHRTF